MPSTQSHFESKATLDASQAPLQAGLLQRKCDCGTHTMSGECGDCAKKKGLLQRKAAHGIESSEAPSIVNEVLRSPGQPLDTATRAFMEPRFGHDFSHVRVHTDAKAAESARSVNALAYTVDSHVVLGSGHYAPHTSSGRKLLAHELTHVVQQSNALSPAGALSIGPVESAHEHEAASAVAAIENGSRPRIGGPSLVLQRQPATHITAPIPKGATVNKAGQASFQINGINVIAEPDRTSADEKMRNRAETNFGLVQDQEAGGQYDSQTNTITSVTPPQIHATVVTTFGPGYDPSKSATYGRGTTPPDKRAGTTNLGFHESRHGADWFEYLKQNAAPVFGGKANTSLDDFQKARDQFHKAIDAYNSRAQDYSKHMTDCTGVLPKERNLATFCRQQTP